MASATAPPTPVSISSNTSVGAEPRSASTTFSASRKRASSPPEATFISGPGRVPGLVCTQNSTRSMPCGPAAAASLSIWVENLARSSLSGLSSPLTALSSAPAALAAACESASAACAVSGFRLRGGCLQRLEPVLAGVDQRDDRPSYLRASAASSSTGTLYLRPAARSANSRSSMRSSSAGSKSAIAKRRFKMATRLVQRVERGVERLHRRLDQARRLRGRGVQAGGSRRTAPARANLRRRSPSWASRRSSATFSACIMAVRRSASAVSSPACGASLSSSSTAWRSQSASRCARSTSARCACAAASRCAPRLPQRFDVARHRPQARQRRRAAGDASRRRPARARRAGRGSRPARCRAACSTCTLTGWSLTKARVRPSANCTRRRIRSSSGGECHWRRAARAPDDCGGTSNTAVT